MRVGLGAVPPSRTSSPGPGDLDVGPLPSLDGETGFDPEVLKRKGKVIRDLAIERGWDREKFAGFDQPLQDRVSAFYASSNEAFAQEHWGVSWNSLFPVRPAAQRV